MNSALRISAREQYEKGHLTLSELKAFARRARRHASADGDSRSKAAGDPNESSCTTGEAEEGSQPTPHQDKTRGDQSPIDPNKKKTCRKR